MLTMYISIIKYLSIFLKLGVLACLLVTISNMDSVQAQQQPEMGFAGEYAGKIYLEDTSEKVDIGLRVTNLSENKYCAILYLGGLQQNESNPYRDQNAIKLKGVYQDYTLKLKGDFPLKFQFIHNRFTALDENNNYMGHLDRIIGVHHRN